MVQMAAYEGKVVVAEGLVGAEGRKGALGKRVREEDDAWQVTGGIQQAGWMACLVGFGVAGRLARLLALQAAVEQGQAVAFGVGCWVADRLASVVAAAAAADSPAVGG